MAKPQKKKYASIDEAMLETGLPVQYCIEDKGFLKKDGTCGAGAFCPYEDNKKCTKHVVRKVIEAGPHEETKGDLEPVRDPNASQPITSLMPKVATATVEDCFNGGNQYLKGGYCIAKECPYQTSLKLEKKAKRGNVIETLKLPKCVAHLMFGCAVDGDKSLLIEGANCCMATGKGEKCEHQEPAIAPSIGEIIVFYCKKYEV